MTGATTDDYFNASVNGNNMEVSGTNDMHTTNEAETVQIGIHKDEYDCLVDPAQDDRATELKILSFKQPHMRSFHISWLAFFFAFFAWFAIAPLMPVIKKSLKLTDYQVYVSNILAVSATVFMRFLVGPLCDIYGPRVVQSFIICSFSIPVYLVGTVNSYEGLCIIRFFIGFIGASFVMCQYWTQAMFAQNIVGKASALTAGWGNLGGGVTQLFMGSAMYPLFTYIYGGDSTKAWRTCFVVPATFTMAIGLISYFTARDCPHGQYADLKKRGLMPTYKPGKSFAKALVNPNVIIMAIQYGASFGVELTFFNVAASYFNAKFGLEVESAAAIAAGFGFMNLVSRPYGGYLSDWAFKRISFRGRLWVQFVFLLLEGIFLICFQQTNDLGTAVFVFILVAFFCQGANGTAFGVVPFIDPSNNGAIMGIVGGGGNFGAICWGFIFLYTKTAQIAFGTLGYCVIGCAMTCFLIRIPGYGMMLCGEDNANMQKSNSRFALLKAQSELDIAGKNKTGNTTALSLNNEVV